MTIKIPRLVVIAGAVVLLVAATVGITLAVSGGDSNDSTTSSSAASTPTPPPAPPLVIRADTSGLQDVGGFNPQIQGLVGATQVFGDPSRETRISQNACWATWDDYSLILMLANFG